MDDITDLECRAVTALRNGGDFECGRDLPTPGDPNRTIRAALLSAVMNGRPALPEDQGPQARPNLIRLRGAHIVGRLDLRDAQGERGGAAPALLIEFCLLSEPIDLSNGHFSRVSLRGSRFVKLIAKHAAFDGQVDLSEVSSSESTNACSGCTVKGLDGEDAKQPRCTADFENSTIDGDLVASGATLCCEPHDPTFDRSGGGTPYALMMSGARVSGSLLLQPSFTAIGGVKLSSARIGGNVWLQGCHLVAEWGDALQMDNAIVELSVALSGLFRSNGEAQPARCEGAISLYSARIVGELYMAGAKLRTRKRNEYALQAHMAQIGKLVRVSTAVDNDGRASSMPFESVGPITFAKAEIGGFMASGGVFDGAGSVAIDFTGACIKGDLQIDSTTGVEVKGPEEARQTRRILHPSVCRGPINAPDVRIDGGVSMIGVRFDGGGTAYALYFPEARIEKSFSIKPYSGQDQPAPGQEFQLRKIRSSMENGALNLLGAKLGGDLILDDVRIGQKSIAIAASKVAIGLSVDLNALRCEGALFFPGADVGKDFRIAEIEISAAANRVGVALDQIRVGGSLTIEKLKSDRQIHAHYARVEGKLLVDAELNAVDWGIDAKGSRVSGDLEIAINALGRVALRQMLIDGHSNLNKVAIKGECGAEPPIMLAGTRFQGGFTLRDGAVSIQSKLSADTFVAFRAARLAFYPGWRLVEGHSVADDAAGVVAFLWNGSGEAILLPGTVQAIHEFNGRKNSPLKLTDETAFEYLCFFCSHVWGEHGAFRIVRNDAPLRERDIDPAPYAEMLAGKVQRDSEGWIADTVVEYGGLLFQSKFKVQKSGGAQMLSDAQLSNRQFVRRQYRAPFRTGREKSDRITLEAQRRLDPARSWPVEPWLPGPWTDLAADPQRSARAVAALRGYVSGGTPLTARFVPRRLRVRQLACYPEWTLVQALVDSPMGQAVLSWLWDGDARSVILTGLSNPIRNFNNERPPILETEEQIKDYLRFFCAYVWGDNQGVPGGAFMLVDDGDDLPFAPKDRDDRAGAIRPLRVSSSSPFIEAEGTVCYTGELFYTRFRIQPSGWVEMLDDEQVKTDHADTTIAFEAPVVRPARRLEAPPPPAPADWPWPDEAAILAEWRALDSAETRRLKDTLVQHEKSARVLVDLSSASAEYFSDNMGEAWGKDQVKLLLGGFTYRNIDWAPPDEKSGGGRDFGAAFMEIAPNIDNRAKKRLDWLKLQFGGKRPQSQLEFNSQPHTQLADVYRRAGRTDDARRILFDKLRWDAKLAAEEFGRVVTKSWLARGALALAGLFAVAGLLFWAPGLWVTGMVLTLLAALTIGPWLANLVLEWGFGYGLYSRNALVTFALFLLVGWVGVEAANRGRVGPPGLIDFGEWPQVLVLDVMTVNDVVVVGDSSDQPVRPALRTSDPADVFRSDIPCGDAIEPFLYAADVFVPLVDLRQETKCRPSDADVARPWSWAKAIYALFGWIVTSLTILTVTGVLRSRSEQTERG